MDSTLYYTISRDYTLQQLAFQSVFTKVIQNFEDTFQPKIELTDQCIIDGSLTDWWTVMLKCIGDTQSEMYDASHAVRLYRQSNNVSLVMVKPMDRLGSAMDVYLVPASPKFLPSMPFLIRLSLRLLIYLSSNLPIYLFIEVYNYCSILQDARGSAWFSSWISFRVKLFMGDFRKRMRQ